MKQSGRLERLSAMKRTISALAIVIVISLAGGCGPHIGGYSKYEIADEIAREQGVERAEQWLTKEYGAEEARRWRKQYESRMGQRQE